MAKQSAGLLVYKHTPEGVRVLLTHPSGPIWSHRDTWSITKGELDENEDHIAAAYREFEEELGIRIDPNLVLIELGESGEKNGKINFIWAVESDIDLSVCRFDLSTFTMEWPPKSGKMQEFPENDRAEWFSLAVAKQKLFTGQVIFIDRLAEHLGVAIDASDAEPQQSLL